MSTARRDLLVRLQTESQKVWSESRVFEENASEAGANEEKFLATFPYPYCNGYLHLGHAFTISKAEFAVAYKRLKGVKCLYPFGFHCTGMPIQACANKLKGEFEKYGKPPTFPAEEETVEEPKKEVAVGRAKKGKAASKASKKKYQWEILKESGLSAETALTFDDPLAWLNYFPTENANDLTNFGLKSDWRRTFITTDVNPFYDSFIRWQFNKLRALQKVKFGKRCAIYSPLDKQPCADHDRASGEQVQPQEYTLIKMKLLELPESPWAEPIRGREIFLPAATLRPETMYGQTNCWVLPTGEYMAFELANGDVYIASYNSARNMAYQDFFEEFGVVKELTKVMGSDLIGLPISSPYAQYEKIYVLPLLTVSMNKGTGIVTSVPSDAPDDFQGLVDLKKKEDLRKKFGVTEEMLFPFEPKPIIKTPGFGNLAAVKACETYKIKSQNDKEKLANAKAEVYKAGFYGGIMLVGSMKGEKVEKAKSIIRKQMIEEKLACVYHEPEKRVESRSGDECVVALCDQWYLEYGEPSWRAQVEECMKDINMYADETRRGFESVVDWLKEWACSRQFGLGSKLPWDKSWLIESLSDSTIYMAYYTVAHMLQGGLDNINGDKLGPLQIPAEDMTDEVWDYIMLGKGTSTSEGVAHMKQNVLEEMRNEFLYWYPVDLRVSGKDLIGNHLTFFMYNHTAIFEKEQWPTGIRVNGHVLLNAEKMSKSTGNFMTLRQAMEQYSTDAVRFALADAGDTVEDANFSKKTADDAVLKLWTLVDFIQKGLDQLSKMRTGPITVFSDRVFVEQMKLHMKESEEAYEKFMFRAALKAGFFETQNDLGKYRESIGADKVANISKMHKDIFLKFVYDQILMLVPICPHTCEYLWGLAREALVEYTGESLPETVMRARWPSMEEPDETVLAASGYLTEMLNKVRAYLSKRQKRKGNVTPPPKPDTVTIYVSKTMPHWQVVVGEVLGEMFNEDEWNAAMSAGEAWKFASDAPKKVAGAMPADQKKNKKVMPYVAMLRKEVEVKGKQAFDRSLKFDERGILEENMEFVKDQLNIYNIKHLHVITAEDVEDVAAVKDAVPGAPAFGCSITSE